MAHYYTADLHLGHAGIIDLCGRPFASVEAMDEALIDNLRATVTAKDDLWILGDLAMVRGPEKERIAQLFQRIPGRKHLIAGNHDKPWIRALNWASVETLREIKDEGRRVTLCHYPLMTWPGARHGALQFFGHVHDNWAGCRGCVNVGVDLWDFRPVTFEAASARSQSMERNAYWDRLEPGSDL